MLDYTNVTEKDLREGGKYFEMFWLRPKSYMDKVVPIRIRINKKWGGWKVKDELISSLNLEIGDTISTEITPCLSPGIIDESNDTDLFASASGADWLMDNNVGVGTIIDCFVRFSYSKAPIGPNGKEVNIIALILEQGISVIGTDQEYIDSLKNKSQGVHDIFRSLLK